LAEQLGCLEQARMQVGRHRPAAYQRSSESRSRRIGWSGTRTDHPDPAAHGIKIKTAPPNFRTETYKIRATQKNGAATTGRGTAAD